MAASPAAGVSAQDAEKELRPKGHLTIENPNQLTAETAKKIYDGIADELAKAYAMAREATVEDYQSWRRLNVGPYLSATHGNRYVNNYANARAAGYGDLRPGERLAAGSVLAKDSFTVTAEGEVFAAALFLMEKLRPGTRPESGDWRYVMILPDGSYFGDTEGDNAALVAYCHTCHKNRASTDFLFQVPKRFRIKE